MARTGTHLSRVAMALVASLLLVGLAPSSSSAYPRPGRITLLTEGGNQDSVHGPVVSANGRYVAFASKADTLVAGDDNDATDIFLRDLKTGATKLISLGLAGVPAIGSCGVGGNTTGSSSPSLSANGRFIAFSSCASNLVTGDLNLSSDVFIHDAKRGETRLVSASPLGTSGIGSSQSGSQAVDRTGRYVVFVSGAPDLVELAADLLPEQVFLRDTATGETSLVSVAENGLPSNGTRSIDPCAPSGGAAISADGRFVVFVSDASNLADPDSVLPPAGFFAQTHTYVRDLTKKETVMVDVASDGSMSEQQAISRVNPQCLTAHPAISSTGRYVTFQSTAGNLVPNVGAFSTAGIYLRDLVGRRTERIDVESNGQNVDGFYPGPDCVGVAAACSRTVQSTEPSLSQDGRYVTFRSSRPLVPGRLGHTDIFLYDRLSGATENLTQPGPDSTGMHSLFPFTADGRRVVFQTDTGDLVRNDTHEGWDDFLLDRGPALGSGELVSGGRLSVAGRSDFSATGSLAASDASADVLAPLVKEGADIIEARLVYRVTENDLFAVIDLERIARLGSPGMLYGFRFSAGGRHYQVRASSLLGGTFGLFDCNGVCAKVADLRGGYGTTGERVVVAIPLTAIGMDAGGVLSEVEAFSALGSNQSGALQVLDSISLVQ